MKYTEWEERVHAMLLELADVQIEEDNEGQLVIYTNRMRYRDDEVVVINES